MAGERVKDGAGRRDGARHPADREGVQQGERRDGARKGERRARKPAEAPPRIELFRLGRRLVRYRVIQGVFVVVAAVFLLLAYRAMTAMENGAGGGLAPVSDRLLVAGLLVALAAGSLALLVAFGRAMITRIEVEGNAVAIETLGTLRRRKVAARAREFDVGPAWSGEYRVRGGGRQAAPGRTIRVPGQRVPMILDLQAELVQEREITRLGSRAKTWDT